MTLDAATVRRIAKLARLHVEEHEVTRLQGELSGILGWIEQLDAVDVSGVPPLAQSVTTALRLRDDVVSDGLTGGGRAEAVLSNAPERAGEFYAVPKVVE
jgi:aspartyl-tRNA(Asn)/glutamyl-tRNA(Gln) amidotransferase subunit C